MGPRIYTAVSALALIFVVGACGGDDAAYYEDGDDRASGENADNNAANDAGNGGGFSNDENEPPPDENPEDYEFTAPAIIGPDIYVANETLNSVAIINSQNLGVRTVLTGAEPTQVVGPTVEAAGDEARAMVLNEGSSTVTAITPETYETMTVSVLRGANSIAASPDGQYGVVWYDDEEAEPNRPVGDRSAISLVSGSESYQIAVGYSIRQVLFDESGQQALILTNDGLSVIDLAAIEDDQFVAPLDFRDGELASYPIRDLNVEITADGDYLVAYRNDEPYLLVTDLGSEETSVVELPAPPTGTTFRAGDDGWELLAVLRSEGQVLRADLPQGLELAAEEQALLADEEPVDDEPVDGEEPVDEEPGDDPLYTEYAGYRFVELPFVGPGAVALTADGDEAFVFTTVGDETRAVLLTLESDEAQVITFEKTIRGVLADKRGDALIVFHNKEPGSTEGLVPTDPEYVARRYGFTILDLASGTTRLILTEFDLDDAVLWSPDTGNAVAYMTFASPAPGAKEPAHRDVLRVDLGSFRKDSFRLSSLPDGLGLIAEAGKIFINQIHPQGRITFVDVESNERQTVTGYQLNAGIE